MSKIRLAAFASPPTTLININWAIRGVEQVAAHREFNIVNLKNHQVGARTKSLTGSGHADIWSVPFGEITGNPARRLRALISGLLKVSRGAQQDVDVFSWRMWSLSSQPFP